MMEWNLLWNARYLYIIDRVPGDRVTVGRVYPDTIHFLLVHYQTPRRDVVLIVLRVKVIRTEAIRLLVSLQSQQTTFE